MAFGLKLRKYKEDIDKRKFKKQQQSLGLKVNLDRKPADLSQQRQRVAMGQPSVMQKYS